MSTHNLAGLFGIALATACLVVISRPMRALAPRRVAVVGIVTLVGMLVPLGALSLAAYVRGGTGDLSITTLVLLACAAGTRLGLLEPTPRGERFAQLTTVALSALGLYPLALGVSVFDPYRLGFGHVALITGTAGLALIAWAMRWQRLAVVVGLGLLAWATQLYESSNLWDYLMDPFVAGYAIVSAISATVSAIRGNRRPPVDV